MKLTTSPDGRSSKRKLVLFYPSGGVLSFELAKHSAIVLSLNQSAIHELTSLWNPTSHKTTQIIRTTLSLSDRLLSPSSSRTTRTSHFRCLNQGPVDDADASPKYQGQSWTVVRLKCSPRPVVALEIIKLVATYDARRPRSHSKKIGILIPTSFPAGDISCEHFGRSTMRWTFLWLSECRLGIWKRSGCD